MFGKAYAAVAIATALSVFAPGNAANAALVISTAPTSNVTCGGVVCAATAANAVLNVHDLERWLAHRDTKVVSGSIAVDIEIDAPVQWTSAHRLTFDAYRSTRFTQPVISTGAGGATITTDDGGTGGDFLFIGNGRMAFWDLSSSLIINGMSHTLVADIQTLASDIATNRSGRYALANDDRETVPYTSSPVPKDFYGAFEGLGNWIVDLHIDDPTAYTFSPGYIGVFSSNLGTIRDINLKAAVSGAVGKHSYVGILVAANGGTVLHCAAYGSVKGGLEVGGLVGWNTFGQVLESHATVSVNGDGAYDAGGLIGRQGGVYLPPPPPDPSSTADSYANGNVTGGASTVAGGLIGGANYSTILRSHATGTVRAGDNALAGGLVGFSYGMIDSSWASGAVSARDESYAGGLAGSMGQDRWQRYRGYLTNSYATARCRYATIVMGAAWPAELAA